MIRLLLASAALGALAQSATAEPITAKADQKVGPAFDIVEAMASLKGGELIFSMSVSGEAGSDKPAATGKFEGSQVHAYVWPTSLDSAAAGFGEGEGILALAVTAHPDFDDTPAYDENGDGKADNDGAEWHSHWVVLAKDESCGGGLKVKDIAPGQKVVLPKTAPGVPLFLDSPGHAPAFSGPKLTIRLPAPEGAEGASFDGVAAGLRVSAEGKAPLLCVSEVFKVASGDLSLPGKVGREE
jgi:hypothetical protein